MATDRYIPRTLEGVLLRALEQFPAVLLTGPRQAGKTTLVRHALASTHAYVSLDAPDVREAAVTDPRGFLGVYPAPVILDEIQNAPALLSYVKERIDADRSARGRWVLTGSQNLLLAAGVTETLAGRVALLRLLPLSLRELAREPDRSLPWERDDQPRIGGKRSKRIRGGPVDWWPALLRGLYPQLVAEQELDSGMWHDAYLGTYLERDVRGLSQVGDLVQFQLFVRALASRSAQLLNLSALAREQGIAVNTAKRWLSMLEASYQVMTLRPFHANLGKRLVKTPKVYFTDTGTLCRLAGLRDPSHAAAGPMAGAILETAVVAEALKAALHRGEDPRLHFWRTATGIEVDLLVERWSDGGGRLVPLEVKTSATPSARMADGIRRLRMDLGDRVAPGYLVHLGDSRLPLGDGITSLPLADL
jgi:predicted AAA+ superfamily ATPase